MSHLTDLAAELTAAEDAFAQGDIEAGQRATSLACTLESEARRAATRLSLAVNRARIDAAWEAGHPR